MGAHPLSGSARAGFVSPRWALVPWLAVVAIGLSSCATIRHEDCPHVDWYQLGVKDGREGAAESRLHEHRRACRDAGVQPDERRYLAGRSEGLRSYCTLPNALAEGMAGRTYNRVCPGPLDAAFLEVNAAAHAVYDVRRRIRDLESSISSRESQLRKRDLSDRDRDRLRSEIREMDRRRDTLRDDLYRHERNLDQVRQRYRV